MQDLSIGKELISKSDTVAVGAGATVELGSTFPDTVSVALSIAAVTVFGATNLLLIGYDNGTEWVSLTALSVAMPRDVLRPENFGDAIKNKLSARSVGTTDVSVTATFTRLPKGVPSL